MLGTYYWSGLLSSYLLFSLERLEIGLELSLEIDGETSSGISFILLLNSFEFPLYKPNSLKKSFGCASLLVNDSLIKFNFGFEIGCGSGSSGKSTGTNYYAYAYVFYFLAKKSANFENSLFFSGTGNRKLKR